MNMTEAAIRGTTAATSEGALGRVPILLYHGLGGERSYLSVTPKRFAQQMDWLDAHEVNVLPLRDVVQAIRSHEPLPPRSLAITFDDGLKSVYTDAWPALVRHGFPATVFLVSGYVARDSGWPGQPAGLARLPTLTWDEVREMHRHGIDFAAHTIDHPRLDLLQGAELTRQVQECKQTIEQEIGHPVELFAYPYGRYSPAVHSVVASTYEGAFTARPGLVSHASNPWLLERIDVAYLRRGWSFSLLTSPILPQYLKMRRRLRRLGSRALRRAWI
jgi:peptidoglycan/xylan/chitin deacetylase (PgdA/CDA1 family)